MSKADITCAEAMNGKKLRKLDKAVVISLYVLAGFAIFNAAFILTLGFWAYGLLWLAPGLCSLWVGKLHTHAMTGKWRMGESKLKKEVSK